MSNNTGELFPVSREGIYGSPLPEGAEPYDARLHFDPMIDAMAEEHAARIEEVRLPDGTVPEMIYSGPNWETVEPVEQENT